MRAVRLQQRVDSFASLVLFVGVVLLVARLLAGCSAAPVAAESAYGAEQLRCVDKATTLAESKACRRAVDARWGVDGGAR